MGEIAMSMMDEFDHLCDRFGEENVCCRNCENWRPVVYGDALPQTFGLCMMKCFEIDAPGDPVVLLKQGSNCFTPDAVRQRFVPVTEIIMQERILIQEQTKHLRTVSRSTSGCRIDFCEQFKCTNNSNNRTYQ